MLSSILGNVLGHVGSCFGGGMLASAGRYIGNWIGSELEDNFEERKFYKIGRVKNNLYPLSTISGRTIPLIYGTAKADGQIIWATSIKETPVETSSERRIKNIIATSIKVDFYYSCSLALGICEGKIQKVERIWANGELLDLAKYNYRLYLGTEDQMPDRLIQENVPEQEAPAHRGLAYIVFEDFPLAEFGNNLPHFSFEVVRYPQYINELEYLGHKIKGVNIIPGSGEFVYDTIIQSCSHIEKGQNIYTNYSNLNNKEKIADSLYSLQYLQEICPNIEWVSPVVCWFGNNLNIANCSIYPVVENALNEHNTYSEIWRVAGKTRENSRVVSRDKFGNPNYGGTISDASVQRYLGELKSRGLKIMFYPMLFMEVEGKPWRGFLGGNSEDVVNFFRKRDGYNNFILHYARLCMGLVDVFIIGSEFVSITKIREGDKFPAVLELINLAKQVRQILGSHVKITYAADWSEYHHTDGGWYYLDDLWSCPDIDFIGIDNYFPLTMKEYDFPTREEIREGMNSGEGYDFYYQDGKKHPLSPAYAWKNLRWFWEKDHYNPNGIKTSWVPKSKKIWFTEFGFPSIDKATNQPNLFYDPGCVSGGVPIHSNSRTNFMIQRTAINEFIDFWNQEEYVENMFLWCFDARPYPSWPHKKKWLDWPLWEKGHWINGKIGHIMLSDVILDVANRCGLPYEMIDFEGIYQSLNGISITKRTSGREFMNLLRATYFFDYKDRDDGGLSLIKRGRGNKIEINGRDLLQNQQIITIERGAKILRPGSITIGYISANELYGSCKEFIQVDEALSNLVNVNLPFVLCSEEAREIGKFMLKQVHAVEAIVSFSLPFFYNFLRPSDLVNFKFESKEYKGRICYIRFEDWRIFVTCTVEEDMNLEIYDQALI